MILLLLDMIKICFQCWHLGCIGFTCQGVTAPGLGHLLFPATSKGTFFLLTWDLSTQQKERNYFFIPEYWEHTLILKEILMTWGVLLERKQFYFPLCGFPILCVRADFGSCGSPQTIPEKRNRGRKRLLDEIWRGLLKGHFWHVCSWNVWW